MQQFKDRENDRWTIDLTIGTVMRVRSASEGRFNLFEAAKDNLAQNLQDDPALFWELLVYIVEPEKHEPPATIEEFGQRMAGDCLLDAQHKFFDEWRDFFQLLQRPDQAAVVEKLAKYKARAVELVTAKLAGPEMTALDGKVESQMQAILNRSFGNLLESVDSTPGPSPSGNSD